MDYGTKLKLARKWANITQKELARRANIAAITIHQYEAGKRKPSMENWFAIANALNLSIDELNNAELLPSESFEDTIRRTAENILDGMQSERRSQALLAAFSQLNPEGQTKAVERVEELTEIPKYQKKPPQD